MLFSLALLFWLIAEFATAIGDARCVLNELLDAAVQTGTDPYTIDR